jgi:cell wall-associated NlpC family hydrolase
MRHLARVTLPPKFYSDLIGKPWRAGARGPDAYDCLGVAMKITRRRGIALPEYESSAEERARSFDEDRGVLGPARAIEGPEPGAVVLLRSIGFYTGLHLGVMLGPYSMIHACEGVGSVIIEPLARSVWAKRVIGFYLPEAAA